MNTVSNKILTEQQLSFAAEMTVPAQLRVVSRNTITNREARNPGSNGYDYSRSLVTSNDRHIGLKVTVMDVQVGTANPARFY